MALKWTAIVVSSVAVTLCTTANVLVAVLRAGDVPIVVNMFAIACASVGALVAVIADLHDRLNGRMTALTEFLVARLNELDNHTGDRNAGFVEGYLLSHGQDAAVVQMAPRMHGRRAMTGGDD
ncbi:hypothetical protein SAMN05444365_101342 [Micromonospora pattaloongensis]|uniref:Uncharacterized protein n=1 Tax=Micromonospora pattaloongensis TaxID=405436 RepID=A0A1H3GAI3_9ACTN|nr:hypothetical protein [Micromonospora pattaloongensis]SDY00271.1 hypothetical protein SAMN05444365_101342 [Micromonospora pattaloongensis]